MHDPSPRMKTGLAIGLAVLGALNPARAQVEAAGKSVVKISCYPESGKPWEGTGFAWEHPERIVTALHVVVGCATLEVHSEGMKSSASAEVIKVLKASDLALLKLEKSMGLTPLKASDEANPDVEYRIWGFPLQVKTMQGDVLRFSSSMNPNSTLADVMSDKKYREVLGNVGYPSLNARILRVGSTIQPGHSGAPICNRQGKVVGIGDGGLYEGIKSINWAIPASTLPSLMASEDKKPAEKIRNDNQYSVRSDGGKRASIPMPSGGAIRLVFSASLGEILETASEDEGEGLDQLSGKTYHAGDGNDGATPESDGVDADTADAGSDDIKVDSDRLMRAIVDVYEDSATGATFAVPQGTELRIGSDGRPIVASVAGGRVTLFIQVAGSGGRKAIREFESVLHGKGNWMPDPDIAVDSLVDEKRIQVEKSYIGKDSDSQSQMLSYSLALDRKTGDFLGTALLTGKIDQWSNEDFQTLAILEACLVLADFRLD